MTKDLDLSMRARELIAQQIHEWDLAAKNYGGLKQVKVKTFQLEGFRIDIQFNPERMVSSAAKVDAKSIEARPCFLCGVNLPKAQKGLMFASSYQILVNPFPIFSEHLTIPMLDHCDQRIAGNFPAMLELSRHLSDFTVFYNGPKCGASAPDHFHFQAGIKGFLPIEKDFYHSGRALKHSEMKSVKIWRWEKYRRGAISLTGTDARELTSVFSRLYQLLQHLQPDEAEPMLNILCLFEHGQWVVHLFPRKLHRPSQYFAEGDQQIVISPASVDLGGVWITPRSEDFEKITLADVEDIFQQVALSDDCTLDLLHQLEASLLVHGF